MAKFLDMDGLAYFWSQIKEKLTTKVDKVNGKQLSTNDYTTAEKDKLAGLSNYTHPSTSGNKHIPTGGTSGQFLKWSADGTAVWAADNNTTYSKVTTTEDGLMAKEDKSKLDGVASGANNYVHPTGDGNQHVPVTGTSNNGKVLKAGATAGSLSWGTLTKADVGLGNVDNTSDASKPISTAMQTALNGKANTTHTHTNTDITSVDASKLTGMIDIARLPQGALERCVVVADDAARLALTTTSVQTGDTVKVTSTGKMYFVVDDSKLSSEAGYEVYTAGTATSVPWSGVTGKPSSYTPETHSHTKSQITDFPTALKNPTALTVQFNGTTQQTYDGATAQTLNITPAGIGALTNADVTAITNAEIDSILAS